MGNFFQKGGAELRGEAGWLKKGMAVQTVGYRRLVDKSNCDTLRVGSRVIDFPVLWAELEIPA